MALDLPCLALPCLALPCLGIGFAMVCLRRRQSQPRQEHAPPHTASFGTPSPSPPSPFTPPRLSPGVARGVWGTVRSPPASTPSASNASARSAPIFISLGNFLSFHRRFTARSRKSTATAILWYFRTVVFPIHAGGTAVGHRYSCSCSTRSIILVLDLVIVFE